MCESTSQRVCSARCSMGIRTRGSPFSGLPTSWSCGERFPTTSLAIASAISSCFFAALVLFVNKHAIAHAISSVVVATPAFSFSKLLVFLVFLVPPVLTGMSRSESLWIGAARSKK